MSRLIPTLFVVLVIPLYSFSQKKYTAFVVNTRSDSATVFNPVTGNILKRIATGKHPQDARLSRDGKQLFVLNMGGGSIAIFDATNFSLISEIALGEWKNPHWSILSRDGKLLWVACGQQSTILEVDVENRTIARSWDALQPGPYNFAVSHDHNKIYTANFDTTTVSIINRKMNEVKVIDIAKQPIGTDISPDGKEIWISSLGSDLISIIDTGSDKVLSSLTSESKGPVRLKFTNDGTRVLIVHNSGELCVFDARQRKLLWKLPLPGKFPKSIAIATDDKLALISLLGGNEVVTVDLEQKKIIHTTRTGRGPEGIVFIE